MAEKLTREQAAIVTAATNTLCGPFADFHELAERLLGRPVWTHELGDEQVAEEIRQAAKPLLLEIVLGLVDDVAFDEHEALTPLRPDVDGLNRSAAQHYTWLADRARALAEEMRVITERPSEYYAAQRSLLGAVDYLRDAAARMEGQTND